MPRAMIFIDGTWLWKNLRLFAREYGERYRLHYGLIRPLVKERLQEELNGAEVDIVRVCMFGSYPVNTHPEDEKIAKAQYEFYMDRKRIDQFDVELFEIDFKGQPLRRREIVREKDEEIEIKEPTSEGLKQKGEASFERPKEKCVDIALATSLLFYAAVPYAYDIAVVVIGDIDYLPVLQHVRRLGKRIMIASIRGSCPRLFSDPTDPEKIRDFPILYLNDYLDYLQLKEEKKQCIHCKKWFNTYYRGTRFICDVCRERE